MSEVATWFLGSTIVCSNPVATKYRFGEPYPHWSLAYCCPRCGEIWARIAVDDSPWEFENRKCPRHGRAFLLTRVQEELNDSASLAIWAREFLIAYDTYMKGVPYDVALVCDGR